MTQIPVLETERLMLREWRESDLDMVDGIYSDEENSRYVGGTFPRFRSWHYLAGQIGHWHLRGFGMWVLEAKSGGEVVGYVGLWRPEGWPENEVGYILHRDHFGNGYATEAAVRSLQYAYSTLGWETAISLIDVKNIGSKNVAGKMGAEFEKDGHLFGNVPAEIWRHLPPKEFLEQHP